MFKNHYIAIENSLPPKDLQDFAETSWSGLRVLTGNPLAAISVAGAAANIMLIGPAIDPFHPELTEQEIAQMLADSCTNSRDLFEETQYLSGRFVLFYKTASEFIVTGDACHLRQIYVVWVDGKLVVTSSPKLFLEYFGLPLNMNAEKKALSDSDLHRRLRFVWYGDSALDDRLQKVLPNHYLDVTAKTVIRLPHIDLGQKIEETEIISYAAKALTGTYDALARRYKPIQPITAGWDSRVLLAASRKVKDRIRYYVFVQSPKERQDIDVSKALSEKLGLDYKIVQTEPLREDFLSVLGGEQILPRVQPNTPEIQYHYDQHYDGDVVNVNGNAAEIARCFYGYTDGPVSLDMVLHFSGYGRKSPFITAEIAKWYKDAAPYAKKEGIPLLDLFYWEQRMGNWGGEHPSLQGIAIEEISPFNNRALLRALLTAPPARRKAPDYGFFRDLVSYLWTETLSEPVNPGEKPLKKFLKGNARIRYLILKLKSLRN
jgi:hypothetical protein